MAIDPQLMAMLMQGGPTQVPQGGPPMGGMMPQGLDPSQIPPEVLMALMQAMGQWRGGDQGPQGAMPPGMTPQSPVGMSPSPQSLPPELLQMLMMGGPPGSGAPNGPMMGAGPTPTPPMMPPSGPSGPPPGAMSGPPPGPPPNMGPSGPGPSGPPPSPPTPPATQGPTPAQAVAEQKASSYEQMLPLLASRQSNALQALFQGIGNDRQGALQSLRNLNPAEVDGWLKQLQQLIGQRLGTQGGPPGAGGPPQAGPGGPPRG
jgi:hypothetical protein